MTLETTRLTVDVKPAVKERLDERRQALALSEGEHYSWQRFLTHVLKQYISGAGRAFKPPVRRGPGRSLARYS